MVDLQKVRNSKVIIFNVVFLPPSPFVINMICCDEKSLFPNHSPIIYSFLLSPIPPYSISSLLQNHIPRTVLSSFLFSFFQHAQLHTLSTFLSPSYLISTVIVLFFYWCWDFCFVVALSLLFNSSQSTISIPNPFFCLFFIFSLHEFFCETETYYFCQTSLILFYFLGFFFCSSPSLSPKICYSEKH